MSKNLDEAKRKLLEDNARECGVTEFSIIGPEPVGSGVFKFYWVA